MFNTKLASLQLYYDENKSHVDEMMMPALYWILIVKQKSTDIHVGQLEHRILIPSQPIFAITFLMLLA